MSKNYKPAGYNAVAPYFVVNDPEGFIEMLAEIFHAKELRRFNRENGSIQHAEVLLDDSVIMVGGANTQHDAIHQLVHIYVPDVDAVIDRAKDYGCRIQDEPALREGGTDRRGAFRDLSGNTWAVATRVSEGT